MKFFGTHLDSPLPQEMHIEQLYLNWVQPAM
jgi:hypothetical protein